MSDVKWTDGEWRVRDRTTNDVEGYEICWSDDDECVTDHVYEKADAYLMAASKELYEALEIMLADYRDAACDLDGDGLKYAQNVIDQARAALAKAKARGE